jgi:hypothetical protein
MLFSPVLLVITIFFAILGFWASSRLKSVFKKYSKVPLLSGMTGKDVALKMLNDNGIYDVQVISVPGKLTDHYNPTNRTVNLSPDVYNGSNISAAAVAAHECGHALQHAQGYAPLQFRSKIVPVVQYSHNILNFLYLGMIFLAFSYSLYNQALLAIIICQAIITLFSLITLPVEFDASQRALAWINGTGVTNRDGLQKASTALKWAASTYVIAALASIATLLFYVMRYMGASDD